MTRINVIPVETLNDQHLLAEHREIKRVPNCIKAGKYSLKGQPSEYTLGTGHVKFFYDKLGFLKDRYEKLYNECIKRGFSITPYHEAFEDISTQLFGLYEPTPEAIEINKERINERVLANPKHYTFNGIKLFENEILCRHNS